MLENKMKIRIIDTLVSIGCLFLLMACSGPDAVENGPAQQQQTLPPATYTYVHFDPTVADPGQIPLPNDLVRNPFTGQLSLPLTGSPAVDGLISQVNTLHGFSTSAPVRIPFAGILDEGSISNSTVLLVDLTLLSQPQQGSNPLVPMRFEVTTDPSQGSVLFGYPLEPLTPDHTFLVVVTSGAQGANGQAVESEAITILLKSPTPLSGDQAALEPIRQLYDSVIWPAAEQVTGVNRVLIPFAFIYTTQPLFNTMAEVKKRAQEDHPTPSITAAFTTPQDVDFIFSLAGLGAAPHNFVGSVYAGTFDAANYIPHPVFGFFQGEGDDLVSVGRHDVPFIAALPPGNGPFPTIIFQHGITSQKEFMLAMANGANANGFAVIAMDLVLHGERSVDVDGDGVTPSGDGFINLVNLLNSRDNIRQSVSDLHTLTRMITSGAADFSDNGLPDLAPVGVTFLGMSLGGIVGGVFVALEDNITVANLNVAGGRIAYLLNGSNSFGPVIDAGLAEFGLLPGSSFYDLYFMFTQAIVDDADPFNYAPFLENGALSSGVGTNVLVQEMIGDQVVPNFATRDLVTAAHFPQVNAVEALGNLAQVNAPHLGSGYYQYPSGSHSSLLDPSGGNPTVQVQTQSLTFILTSFLGPATIVDPFTTGNKLSLETLHPSVDVSLKIDQLNLFPGGR